jgi:hypothetical protein
MFEIDLLKGKGRPVKSQPWAVALVTAPSLIPLIALAFLIGGYVTNGITISSMNEQITKIEARLAKEPNAKLERDKAQQQITAMINCSVDAAKAVKNHMQWSDVIAEVAKNRPGNIILYRLSGSRSKVPLKTGASGNQQNSFQFTLVIGAYTDIGEAGGASISKFINALNSSTLLGPRIETIKATSSRNGTYQGGDKAVYDIECVFKAVQ